MPNNRTRSRSKRSSCTAPAAPSICAACTTDIARRRAGWRSARPRPGRSARPGRTAGRPPARCGAGMRRKSATRRIARRSGLRDNLKRPPARPADMPRRAFLCAHAPRCGPLRRSRLSGRLSRPAPLPPARRRSWRSSRPSSPASRSRGPPTLPPRLGRSRVARGRCRPARGRVGRRCALPGRAPAVRQGRFRFSGAFQAIRAELPPPFPRRGSVQSAPPARAAQKSGKPHGRPRSLPSPRRPPRKAFARSALARGLAWGVEGGRVVARGRAPA